jgi:hypothetical protein
MFNYLKNNLNIVLRLYNKIDKKYNKYNSYSVDINPNYIFIFFIDECKTKKEIIEEKLTNRKQIFFLNEIHCFINYVDLKTWKGKEKITLDITTKLYKNDSTIFSTSNSISFNIDSNFNDIFKYIELTKNNILNFNIKPEAIINSIETFNKNNEQFGPIIIKKIKEYFVNYKYINRHNILEVLDNMPFGFNTANKIKENIIFELLNSELAI